MMRECSRCGRKVLLGGRRFLRRVLKLERLTDQLQEASYRADAGIDDVPPRLRSVLLEVRALLPPLIVAGQTLAVDLHERAHDSGYSIDRERVDEWEKEATEVLSEVLHALALVV